MKMKDFKKILFWSAVFGALCFLPVITNAGLVTCSSVQTCNFNALGLMFVKVIKFVLNLGMTLSAIGFAWAGVLYLTAGGDTGKIAKAHEIFKKILIGFIIALLSFIIVDLIAKAFGLDSSIQALFNSFIP